MTTAFCIGSLYFVELEIKGRYEGERDLTEDGKDFGTRTTVLVANVPDLEAAIEIAKADSMTLTYEHPDWCLEYKPVSARVIEARQLAPEDSPVALVLNRRLVVVEGLS